MPSDHVWALLLLLPLRTHLLEHLARVCLCVPLQALQLLQHLPTRQVFQHQHLQHTSR